MDRKRSEQFSQEGFLGPIRLLTEAECRQFHEAASGALRRESPADWAKGYAASSPAFHSIATHPAIVDLVSELLGENFMVWGAGMPTRPPGVIHRWHTDIESAASEAPTVSVWIGIQNTSVDSSLSLVSRSHRFGVTVQEESHRHGLERQEIRTEDIARWAAERDHRSRLVTPDISDGEAIIFHGHLWHHSLNTSSTTRQALLLQYAVPEARIRIPDSKHLMWPWKQLEQPRPACVMVRGRDTAGVNRFVPPPAANAAEPGKLLSSRVHPLSVPLPPDREKGWKPYPLFRGRTKAVTRLSCHVSTLLEGCCPHPPHRHDEEEILVLLSGNIEIDLPNLSREERQGGLRMKPGEFVYYPAQFAHTLTSLGPEPANYLMFKWRGESRSADTPLGFQKHSVLDVVQASGPGQGFRPRRIFQHPTLHLADLNCHVSTLTPGAGYAPHADRYDVGIVLLQGEIEAVGERITDYGVMFFPAGELHGIYNPGDSTAVYLVFEFHGREGGDTTRVHGLREKRSRLSTRTTSGVGASPADMSRPIFVMGSGRSGTTLVQRIINAAPDTAVFGEHNGFLRHLAESYFLQKAKGCADASAGQASFQDNVTTKLKNPKAWPGWLNPYREDDLRRHYAAFIAGCLNPPWIGAQRWGFKEIRYGGSDEVVDMLLEVFPGSRFVFVVRNPVDTIASQRFCAFGEFEDLLDAWVTRNQSYIDYARDRPDECRILRYEHIVASPGEAVRTLYDWLELRDAPAGIAVVDLPEGRYEMRAGSRQPREMLDSQHLSRIFSRTHELCRKLCLAPPIVPEQKECVAVGLNKHGARLGPFSDNRVILCDASMLALWTLCDGRRDLNTIVTELSEAVSGEHVFPALADLLSADAIMLKAKTG